MGRKNYCYFNVIMTGNINSERKLRKKKSIFFHKKNPFFFSLKKPSSPILNHFFCSFATISRRNHATRIRTIVCSFEEKTKSIMLSLSSQVHNKVEQ